MSVLKPPMTPASMGSLPTPTAQVLPSPAGKQGLGVSTSAHTPTAITSPYRSSNPHLPGSQKSRREQAVVFVFDATYLTREMFFKVTAKGGSLEGIMRRLVDNGKQSVRVGKASEGPSNVAKAARSGAADEQGKGKGKANEDEGFEVRSVQMLCPYPRAEFSSSSFEYQLSSHVLPPLRHHHLQRPEFFTSNTFSPTRTSSLPSPFFWVTSNQPAIFHQKYRQRLRSPASNSDTEITRILGTKTRNGWKNLDWLLQQKRRQSSRSQCRQRHLVAMRHQASVCSKAPSQRWSFSTFKEITPSLYQIYLPPRRGVGRRLHHFRQISNYPPLLA
mgnify:CR=1 FL=1